MPRPVHFEIHATDPERAITFYTAVFEWSFERSGPGPYWLITTGEGPGIDGGLAQREGPIPDPDASVNAFPLTMEVPDLDLMAREVEQAGGRVVAAKRSIAGVGWIAYCRDPEGNLFGMLQPDPSAG
ncbi:VOC family protein [Saccharomonospora cyanea]|uniref:Lactoylglutathione lyase family protein n=1 Tax=Saccharomonospora cyanea NA-134 TaxID=882082 RepID=H5XR33_9PSEU|nr:VOC family protein [Saccharomonospora cyanea]EHR62274.1 lactoylglutathione lyase family protein [Saccharomonospora cyanea NA-134]